MLGIATTFDRAAALAPDALLDRARETLAEAGVGDGEGTLVLDAHLAAQGGGERMAMLLEALEARRGAVSVIALEGESGLFGRPALAALDKEESLAAITSTEASLRRAAAIGARFVVLRLGWVEGARRDWTFARDRFHRRALPISLGQRLVAARDQVAPAHVDRARAALDRLCRLADSVGVRLLLKNGQRYVELPSPREVGLLLGDLHGAPLGSLFDLPAAHLPDVMGIYPLALTEAAFGGGPLVYAGDACGAIGALEPGHGELGRARIAEALKRQKDAVIALRPWAALTAQEVTRALGLLRQLTPH